MNIDDLIADLDSIILRNDTLKLLSQIMIDSDPRLIQSLVSIIKTPQSIEDTNRFASILKFVSKKEFIQPLIEVISQSKPHETPWLADYMYTLQCLLEDQDDYWEPDDSFVHLLGNWLLTTDGGEISWKAGLILAEIQHPSTRQYLLKGAFDQTLLHLTRAACIGGIVNHYRNEAVELLQQLANDPDTHVQETVASAQQFLNSRTTKK
jgi:hypothetical protein